MIVLLFLACADNSERVDTIVALEGDPSAGEAGFTENCERRHGPAADGSDGSGPVLAGAGLDVDTVVDKVLKGGLVMPSFEDLDNQDIADVAAYVVSLE